MKITFTDSAIMHCNVALTAPADAKADISFQRSVITSCGTAIELRDSISLATSLGLPSTTSSIELLEFFKLYDKIKDQPKPVQEKALGNSPLLVALGASVSLLEINTAMQSLANSGILERAINFLSTVIK